MPVATQVQSILNQLGTANPHMGDVRKLAATIKTDHALAMELWATNDFGARLLAVLIMDKKQLDQKTIEALADDMAQHPADQRDKLADWLLANQLMKSKRTTALIDHWQDHRSPVLRRLFWYRQGRLRWMGTIPPQDTAAILARISDTIADEPPEVQWAMNFTAGWIGVYQPEYRADCVALGERLGLYKDDPVSKGCTPNYLPEFIRIEVAKRAS